MYRKIACFAALMCLLVPSSSAEVKICMSVKALSDADGYKNYLYTAKVLGSVESKADAFGIVAMDMGEVYWVQYGTIMDKLPSTVRFGVSNISHYPLEFKVVALNGVGQMRWFRNMPSKLGPVLESDMNNMTFIDQNACSFRLDFDKPISDDCQC